MAEIKQVYSGKHLVHYGQIGIWDKADHTAYPEPKGPLPWWGPKGLVVPACSDVEVDLTVLDVPSGGEAAVPGMTLLCEGDIEVGNAGLTLGNITTASTAEIDWPVGKVRVAAYYSGGDPAIAEKVVFVMG